MKGLDGWSKNQQLKNNSLARSLAVPMAGLRAKFDSFGGESDDEANGHGGDARAFTRSELALWETARAADESAAIAGQLAEEAADTELTEDTVRMYLREISRVALLTAADEVVLARAVEIAQWLEKIENRTYD